MPILNWVWRSVAVLFIQLMCIVLWIKVGEMDFNKITTGWRAVKLPISKQQPRADCNAA